MQHQQVGDASVLVEGQAERWFGLSGSISVAVHAVGVSVHSVDTVHLAIYAVDSIGNAIFWRNNKSEMDLSTSARTTSQVRRGSDITTICLLLLLLFLLHFLLLIQVDVGRLHPDDGFVQEAESFLYMFGLHLWVKRVKLIVVHTVRARLLWKFKILQCARFR